MDMQLELEHAHGGGKAILEYSFWQAKSTESVPSTMVTSASSVSSPTSVDTDKAYKDAFIYGIY